MCAHALPVCTVYSHGTFMALAPRGRFLKRVIRTPPVPTVMTLSCNYTHIRPKNVYICVLCVGLTVWKRTQACLYIGRIQRQEKCSKVKTFNSKLLLREKSQS